MARIEAENPEVTIQDLLPLVSGQIGRKAYETGDVSRGTLSAGQSLGLVHDVAPLAEIVRELEAEMAGALDRVAGLRA